MQENTRNVILMVVLTLAVIFGYNYFYLGPKMAAEQETYEAQLAEYQAALDARQAALDAEAAATTDGGPSAAPATSTDAANTPTLSTSTRYENAGFVSIDTPSLSGRITLEGARFDELTLLDYAEELGSEARVSLLKNTHERDAYYARFGWNAAAGQVGAVPTGKTLWTASADTVTPDTPVTLSWTNEQGVTFEQVISVDDQYMFTINQRVINAADATQAFSPYGFVYRRSLPDLDALYILHEGPLGVFNGVFEADDLTYSSLEDEPVRTWSDYAGGWMGITDKYWMAVLIPDQSAVIARAEVRRREEALEPVVHRVTYVEEATSIAPGTTFERTSHFYAGAKRVTLIDQYAAAYEVDKFDRAVDWGWFYFLTRPIFFLLDFFNSLVGNFGVAIIMLVILLKAILYPLANKQYESMAHMKEAQPKLKALQERYKDDKARLQQEMMALYKKEKINPLAGCLPLVPQIFIFFALYKVLYVTIEMRHEPFFGWISDLSAPDPLTIVNLFGLIPWDPPSFLAIGIWPMLMGGTMYLQQKLSPTQMDETQQKIMMFLPIIFTFIMAGFSAGLVIYWTLNSLLSVLQQWVIMRRFAAKPSKG